VSAWVVEDTQDSPDRHSHLVEITGRLTAFDITHSSVSSKEFSGS